MLTSSTTVMVMPSCLPYFNFWKLNFWLELLAKWTKNWKMVWWTSTKRLLLRYHPIQFATVTIFNISKYQISLAYIYINSDTKISSMPWISIPSDIQKLIKINFSGTPPPVSRLELSTNPREFHSGRPEKAPTWASSLLKALSHLGIYWDTMLNKHIK